MKLHSPPPQDGCAATTVQEKMFSLKTLTHHQAGPDRDHQLQPGRKLGDNLGDEGGDGVSVVWFVELSLIKTINQDDVVLFR